MIINGFRNSNVYIRGKGIVKSNIAIENGKIDLEKACDNCLELDDKFIVVPGFIDKHIHGANNSDAMYPTYKDILNISRSIAKEGVTSYLPTTMTQSEENIIKALQNIKIYIEKQVKEGAGVLGIHLEGPFISKKHKGSQPEEYIMPCDIETFKRYQSASGNNIRQVTFAYEEGGREFAEYLADNNIVASIGHSDAGVDLVLESVRHGVTSATHVYNAMRPLHHREAGTVGGSFLAKEIYAELIADLVHVSPEAINILYKMKGKHKITLITDAIEAKHLPDGVYKLGGQNVYVKGREARLDTGVLAGSTLAMNDAVRNFMSVTKASLTETVDMATFNPARILGIEKHKGSIKTGKDADLAVIDKDLNVYLTVRGGNIIYNNLF